MKHCPKFFSLIIILLLTACGSGHFVAPVSWMAKTGQFLAGS
jgi:hypothetical protein